MPIPAAPTDPTPRVLPSAYIDPREFDLYAAAWEQRDAALLARIAELTPAPKGTVFGVNAPHGKEKEFTDLLKPRALRYYFQPGEMPVYPLPQGDWPLDADQFLVASMKKIDLTVAQLVAFFRQLPTDRITFVSGWHEPKDQLEKKTFTKAQYDALYARMRQAQQQVGDHIQIIAILEGIAFLAGNNPDTELPSDPSTYDVVGVDPYFSGQIGQPITKLNSVLDVFAKKAASLGKPWAVCETGVGQNLTGQARLDALMELAKAIIAHGALFCCYFLGKANTTEWVLKASDGSRDAWLRGAGLL